MATAELVPAAGWETRASTCDHLRRHECALHCFVLDAHVRWVGFVLECSSFWRGDPRPRRVPHSAGQAGPNVVRLRRRLCDAQRRRLRVVNSASCEDKPATTFS